MSDKTNIAYLHFGGAFCGLPNGPMQTVSTEFKVDPLEWQSRGLSYNATGYGARIPTVYKVKWEGKWRRVYVCNYGNSGTAYIGSSKQPLATVSID